MLPFIFAAFVFCFVLERARPGWRLPARARLVVARPRHQRRAARRSSSSPASRWERWASHASLLHLSRPRRRRRAGGLIAYFIATFIFYWWHRARHESDLLWRLFHQIHHSPQRLEVITSFYKHPIEMMVNSLIGSLLVYALLGLTPEAGAVYTLCTALGEFFYHTNMTDAALGRLLLPAPRDAPHPPRARPPSQQLRRHHVVGHAVRHLREPGALQRRPAASTTRASSASARCCAGATCTAAEARPRSSAALTAIENSTALLIA